MGLENNYYSIVSEDRGQGKFCLRLLDTCDVYRGHFPGKAVCPAVCNIETVKELAQRLTGQSLWLSSVKRCRLTAVASPDICPVVDVSVNTQGVEGGYAVTAVMEACGVTYLTFQGTFLVK